MSDYRNPHLGRDLLLDEDGDLQVGNDGDLALTPHGRACLIQDVKHVLDTMAGDLFGHPRYGAGVARLLGEEGPAARAAFVRAVQDALIYEEAVAPRIVPDNVTVRIESFSDRSVTMRTEFEAIDGSTVVPMNEVFGFGE